MKGSPSAKGSAVHGCAWRLQIPWVLANAARRLFGTRNNCLWAADLERLLTVPFLRSGLSPQGWSIFMDEAVTETWPVWW